MNEKQTIFMFQTKTREQVSPNDSSSRLWDRICKYNITNLFVK